MRKRNEASKSGQRPGTRNSSVPAREESKSFNASKEQGKSLPKVSKVVVEPPLLTNPGKLNVEAPETVPRASPPKSSKSKKEISVAPEAEQGGVGISSSTIDPVLPESSQSEREILLATSSIDPVLPETSQPEREISLATSLIDPVLPETSQPEREISLETSSIETCQPMELTLERSLLIPENPGSQTLPTPPESIVSASGTEKLVSEASRTHSSVFEAAEGSARSVELAAETRTEVSDHLGTEREKAASTPDSSSGGGGNGSLPSKELLGLPLQPQVVEKTEPVPATADLLPSDARGYMPLSVGPADPPCFLQEVKVLQNNATCESNFAHISAAEKNGSFLQQAMETSMGDGGQTLNPARATEAYEEVPKDVKETPLFAHGGNTFDNNMVSSVEGETVLIIESLGLASQVPTKVEGRLSGIGETNGMQKEADRKENTENMFLKENDLVGRTFRKRFGKKFFEGKVVEFDLDQHWYKVVYEDGDVEELDIKEVQRLLSLSEEEEDERPLKRKHRRSSSIPSSVKRSTDKAKARLMQKDGNQASSDDILENDSQQQEGVRLRGLKRSLVVDTSNDISADSLESDIRTSASSDTTSDENDEPVSQKRASNKKSRRKARSNKRKKKDEEREYTAAQPRYSSRYKEEPGLKNQEAFSEHRITRRSSVGAQMTSSDDRASSGLKKVQMEFQEKSRPESPVSEIQSPLGGGAKLIGRKTKKDFGGQFYFGKIVSYDNRVKYYKVRYEDGDEEELEWGELEPTLLPQDGNYNTRSSDISHEGSDKSTHGHLKEHSRRSSTSKSKGAIIVYEGGANNGDVASATRRVRKKTRSASVSVMMKGMEDGNAASTSSQAAAQPPPRPLAAVRFASASDADIFEYFGWGEIVNFDRSKCPELRATRLLPTSSPVVHLAASRHHLAALTASGQVWVWRCKHGNIHTRCNEWEHVALLDNRNVILVDIAGPDVDRTSAGYQAEQEDQVPDAFYLAAVCSSGEDIILQGSQPHEFVHTYQYDGEPQHPCLSNAILHSNPGFIDNVGKIVQVSVGVVEAADESPFIGYITDMDCVYIRSATRDYMEEVNLVTGYTGKPIKIQCGRVYHAILMTDDGRAWTWGQGYYRGSNLLSAGYASKWNSPFSVCQPAVGTLVGRKVVDVGCYGEDFIALTNDGDVHQWTHALPNPAAGVYNVPATPVYGQGPSIASGDKLKQVSIGAGICAGISESGRVHTWRTSLKGGFVGTVGLEREVATPLGRDEGYTDTTVLALGTRFATRVMCVAGSLLVVVKRKYRGRRGGKRKLDPSLKEKPAEDEAIADC